MTVITELKSAPRVENVEMMRPFYKGMQDAPQKMGVEVEFSLFQKDTLKVPEWLQTKSLFEKVEAAGYGSRHEPPTSALELASPPFEKTAVKDLIAHINSATTALCNTAKDLGVVLSPFGHLPHVLLDEIEVVHTHRYQSFFAPPRIDMDEVYEFFTSCMNIQVSLGYKCPDHLLRIVRMVTALEPILFLTTDSSAGYHFQKPIRHVQNIAQKNKMGRNTGIPDFYYTAKSGPEFVDAHINYSMTNRHVFTAFNYDGVIERLPAGKWCRFIDLEERGHGPQDLTNYLQVQSQSWRRACNIATIMDDDGHLANHRAEIAAFQNGLLHQRVTAIILGYLIGFDEEFYEKTQGLLREFGIDLTDLKSCKTLLEANFDAACHHDNQYYDVDYGTGSVKDFVTRWADIIETAAARHDLTSDIAPALHIMRTGRPDWLVYRQAFPTYEDTVDYLRRFAGLIAENPSFMSSNQTADQLFKEASITSKSLAS